MRTRSLSAALMAAGVVWAAACAQEEAREGSGAFARDSAGIIIEHHGTASALPACQLAQSPSTYVGTSRTPDDELYRVFGAARLSDGRLAVVNQGSQQVKIYGPDGGFLMNVGAEGDGPGEFRRAYHVFVLPGDTLWVGDYSPFVFEVFGPDGAWVRDVRPTPEYLDNPQVLAVLHDGRSVLAPSNFLSRNMSDDFTLRTMTLRLHGRDGAAIDTIGVFPNGRLGRPSRDGRGSFQFALFESFTHVDAGGSRVLIGHGASAEVKVYETADAGVRLSRIVRWDPGDLTVRDQDVEARLARYSGVAPSDALARIPVAETFPSMDEVRLGADGRLWVRQYQRGDLGVQHREWIGLSTDRSSDCRLAVDLEVLVFGDHDLIGLERDSLDVEHVGIWTVEGP